jgi:hypothetical protein
MAGPQHTVKNLVPVILLSALILFDDNQRNHLYFFIGGKPFATVIAHPSSSD